MLLVMIVVSVNSSSIYYPTGIDKKYVSEQYSIQYQFYYKNNDDSIEGFAYGNTITLYSLSNVQILLLFK